MANLKRSALAGPALAVGLGNRVFLAWVDRDTRDLTVMKGMEVGAVKSRKAQETSFHAPALAEHNGRLFMAWTGDDQRLNIMASNDGLTWTNKPTNKQTLQNDFSQAGPSLASHMGRLYMAYQGLDNRIYIIPAGDGLHFDENARVRTNQTTIAGPSIAARRLNAENQFFLAWTGTDASHRIHMRFCYGTRFEQLSAPHSGFSDTSQSGPSMNAARDSLLLVYRGEAGDHLYEIGAGGGSTDLGNRKQYAASSGFAPAVARSQTRGFIAWTEKDDAQNINFSPSTDMPTL